MARASAIACGYEDAIDLGRLRHDPLMKVAVGRCPERRLVAAGEIRWDFLAPNRWQVKGRRCSVGHDGFGARLMRDTTRRNSDLLP
jgi:hypothetical protein